MNFLEQLVAEWYEYRGYFARTNIKFDKRKQGGYSGEMDVVAFHPTKKEAFHIETSSDADSWKERDNKFRKKFGNAAKQYIKLFPFVEGRLKKIAIVGYGEPKKRAFGPDIEVKSISSFIQEICEELAKTNIMSQMVPEQYPLLRAIQMVVSEWED